MRIPRIDASIICFALVVGAAIPVTALRSRTYTIGYELGKLKHEEKALKARNIELKTQLATTQRQVRDRYSKNNLGKKPPPSQLELPKPEAVLRSEEGEREP